MPPKKARGMEITRAQGQEMTKNTIPLRIQLIQSPPSSGGTTARIAARITTIGV